jgi:16S rRNA (adenine1518-N6/adenine1519-N6)-dimethyltransferase
MSTPPPGAARLRDLLRRHGVRPSKTLGQNFVVDPNTIRKICSVAELEPAARVLEIGAGAGSLTLALASAAAHVSAVELDRALLPVLHEVLDGLDNVEIVRGDALRMDLGSFDATSLVGNLPYNIATPLVVRILQEAPQVTELTVMTQREVGERLASGPGTKAYGPASVIVGFFAWARVAMRVSRHAFYPMPRVESVVVRIVRRTVLPDVDRQMLFAVVRAAFGQRRKMLRRSLAPVARSAPAAARALERAGVDPGSRAEQLGVDEFVAVTRHLATAS